MADAQAAHVDQEREHDEETVVRRRKRGLGEVRQGPIGGQRVVQGVRGTGGEKGVTGLQVVIVETSLGRVHIGFVFIYFRF